MTREEALRILDTIPTIGDQVDALEMAIEALERTEKHTESHACDCISRQSAIDAIERHLHIVLDGTHYDEGIAFGYEAAHMHIIDLIQRLSSAQHEKEIPRRVLWSGWKGTRDTRYKCPNCNKPVKNDDVYCHRCGQKLMFPHISHTPYIEGQKQELIVRWDDEE